MLFYTENVLKFAFSLDTTEIDNQSSRSEDHKIGVLGVPFDGTASYMPGARFGPRSVREASYNFERYNLLMDKTITTKVYDLGDLEVVHGNFKKTCSNLRETISEVLDMEMMPLTIGGDHSISFCVLKAMDESDHFDVSDFTIIHFDAHMDLRDSYLGEKYSHATVMRRIFDLNPKELIQIGVRSASEDEAAFGLGEKIKTFKSSDVDDNINEILDYIKNINGPIYLSFDIDVLDPSYAPAVGTPASCGLNPKQVEKMINSLIGKEIVGFDMVEVCSANIGDITALNAAKIIYDLLCLK